MPSRISLASVGNTAGGWNQEGDPPPSNAQFFSPIVTTDMCQWDQNEVGVGGMGTWPANNKSLHDKQ